VLGGALGQWPLGKLSDRVDRRYVIVGSTAAVTVVSLWLFWLPRDDAPLIFALGALWGALAFPTYTLGVAFANDQAEAGDFVEISSGLLVLFAIGGIAGPILASTAMGSLGATALFLYFALVYASLGSFILLRIPLVRRPGEDDRILFAEALQATQTVSQVFDLETQIGLVEAAEDADAQGEGEDAAGTADTTAPVENRS
jgi:MFS family permease